MGKDYYAMMLNFRNSSNTCNGITSATGAHFILRIDKILLKEKYRKTILNGVSASGFPPLPVDFRYRNNKNFWISRKKRPLNCGYIIYLRDAILAALK